MEPLMVKLSPNVTDITDIAKSVAEAGADSISLINTLTGMAIDIETRRPKLANITGGLSGPAIKPIALAKVYQVAKAVTVPLIGIGGIMDWQSAIEFLIVGATAVEIGTLNFVEPEGALKVVRGIERFCEEKGFGKLTDLVGTLQEN